MKGDVQCRDCHCRFPPEENVAEEKSLGIHVRCPKCGRTWIHKRFLEIEEQGD